MSRTLRWLLVPLLVLPLGWLLFTGPGNDPRVRARYLGPLTATAMAEQLAALGLDP